MNFDMEAFLITLALVVRLRKIRIRRRHRQEYIRPIFKRRDKMGESFLVKELRMDRYYHHRYFRMTKDTFDWLLEKVRPMITHKPTHLRPISAVERLAITLRYLATGNSQISLALSYRVSPAAISKLLRETMHAICDVLEPEFLPRVNHELWEKNEEYFSNYWNFPLCCGAIDGKHIRIKAPPSSGSQYFNYKDYFSIVLLAVVSGKYEFSAVLIGASGSESDGGILMNSELGRNLNSESFLPPPKTISPSMKLPHIFVADEGFPLKATMMKPYPKKSKLKDEKIFNYRLSRARMPVENAFGILAARWRIFFTAIEADVKLAKLIVKTAVLLHNFTIKQTDWSGITPDRIENDTLMEGNWRAIVANDTGIMELSQQGSNNFMKDASDIRNSFKNYFNSPEGCVSWQEAHVMRGFE